MWSTSKVAGILAAAGLALTWTAPARAEDPPPLSRTWVSAAGGDDHNPCSRNAPCKTFTGAIWHTAIGGEITCVDPGGYGPVLITRSVSIVCSNGGSIVAIEGKSITIDGVGADVYLKGLDLIGAGTGAAGINFTKGNSLHVEDMTIRGFNAGTAAGIRFAPTASAQLYVINTHISENGLGTTGGGIVIQPAAGGFARASIVGVRLLHNANNALSITSSASPTGNDVYVRDAIIVGNGVRGISISAPAGTAATRVFVDHATISSNGGAGIFASGTSSGGNVANTTIARNSPAITLALGATLNTFGDNRVLGNSVDGGFTLPVLTRQ